jgi:peptidoglycan/LPS O-acetylase OafA/YrhL
MPLERDATPTPNSGFTSSSSFSPPVTVTRPFESGINLTPFSQRPPLTVLPERNLDVLRSVAVLCVLVDHLWRTTTRTGGARVAFSQLGTAGVLLFFVHTALVLMSSLERQGQSRHWVRSFYVRRALRIYPLAMVTVLLALVLPTVMKARGIQGISTTHLVALVGANLLLVQNLFGLPDILAPYWSLPLEVDMYLLLPLCYLIARRPTSRPMLVLLAALVAGYLIVSQTTLPGAWRFSVFHYGPCFFGGVLAYHQLRRRARPVSPAWTIAPLLAVAVAIVPLMHVTNVTYVRAWIPSLGVGLLLPWIVELPTSVITRAANSVAKYSYGIYLLHAPVLWFAFRTCGALPVIARIAIFLAGIVIVPVLAFHAIERPGIRLGQRLTTRRLDDVPSPGAP